MGDSARQPLNDPAEGMTAGELADIRGHVSLAAQVIYQTRVMALLREAPHMAVELLRDPVLLAKAYKERWESDTPVYEIDDPDDDWPY